MGLFGGSSKSVSTAQDQGASVTNDLGSGAVATTSTIQGGGTAQAPGSIYLSGKGVALTLDTSTDNSVNLSGGSQLLVDNRVEVADIQGQQLIQAALDLADAAGQRQYDAMLQSGTLYNSTVGQLAREQAAALAGFAAQQAASQNALTAAVLQVGDSFGSLVPTLPNINIDLPALGTATPSPISATPAPTITPKTAAMIAGAVALLAFVLRGKKA